MGEAKRKAQARAGRPWAKGALKVIANGVECFDWHGTRQDAVDLQKKYLGCVNALGVDAQSYGKRAVGYLMAFGAPVAGQPRLCPSGFGEPWDAVDVELNKLAALWLGLREHIPDTGTKVEDIFVGKVLAIIFNCDRDLLLEETRREFEGLPFTGGEFQMMVGTVEPYLLDPAEAIAMPDNDLGMAGSPQARGEPILVPRIPHDGAEAKAMLELLTLVTDTTGEFEGIRTYAGYTQAELLRGRVGVSVR
jgi:hypothetical protein